MSTAAAEITRIQADADAAYDANPGGEVKAPVIAELRRLLPEPQAERPAA